MRYVKWLAAMAGCLIGGIQECCGNAKKSVAKEFLVSLSRRQRWAALAHRTLFALVRKQPPAPDIVKTIQWLSDGHRHRY